LKLTLGGPALLQSLTQTLSGINVSVQTLVFDVADRVGVLKRARAAAFLDAKNKFNDYLSLTSLSNDGLKKISDFNSEVYTPYQSSGDSYALFSKLRWFPNPVSVSASVGVTWKVRR
jgi:uncharacterized protein YggE